MLAHSLSLPSFEDGGFRAALIASFELLKSDEVEWRHRSVHRGRNRGPRRPSKAIMSDALQQGRAASSKLPTARSAFLIAVLSGLGWLVIFGLAIGLRSWA